MNAKDCLDHLLFLEFQTVLDLGCGEGFHAKVFRDNGKEVKTCGLLTGDIVGDYNELDLPKFDCIWASHVLEHQLNVNMFLKKCFNDLNEDGILAITVPPMKKEIVGGHVTLWNQGLLLYNLILAGFDCSQAWFKTYGYNISVVVRKKSADLSGLIYDNGDINRISKYFPYEVSEGFDGS